jgi:hypothetical protein
MLMLNNFELLGQSYDTFCEVVMMVLPDADIQDDDHQFVIYTSLEDTAVEVDLAELFPHAEFLDDGHDQTVIYTGWTVDSEDNIILAE